jgi:hypothetical protein
MFTKKHGLRLGNHPNVIYFKYDFFVFRYLAPPFLASVGAVGYVGYALSQTKPIPSSTNISFLHLVGVAGKHFLIIYSKYIFQTTF